MKIINPIRDIKRNRIDEALILPHEIWGHIIEYITEDNGNRVLRLLSRIAEIRGQIIDYSWTMNNLKIRARRAPGKLACGTQYRNIELLSANLASADSAFWQIWSLHINIRMPDIAFVAKFANLRKLHIWSRDVHDISHVNADGNLRELVINKFTGTVQNPESIQKLHLRRVSPECAVQLAFGEFSACRKFRIENAVDEVNIINMKNVEHVEILRLIALEDIKGCKNIRVLHSNTTHPQLFEFFPKLRRLCIPEEIDSFTEKNPAVEFKFTRFSYERRDLMDDTESEESDDDSE